jgi:hemerythrin
MALQWTSTLSVGVPEIDEQHRELFRRIDRLLDAMLHQDRSEAGRMIDFLRGFVVEHFAAEERLMVEVTYPDAEQHVREHRTFASTLADLDAEFAAHGATASVVFKLEKQVVGWLADHVYFTDVALGRYVQAQRASAARRAAC